MYLCDSHLHTHHSFDGYAESTVDAICRAALDAGLAEISITDHCDINGAVEGIYAAFSIEQARDEVFAAREKYAGRLIVNWGVELGQPNQYPAEAAAFVKDGGFDFVLGSLHNLTAVPDFYYMRFGDMPEPLIDQLFARNLEEALAVVRLPYVNALAHLTYLCRYTARDGRDFDPMRHSPAMERLFGEMIARGVALEVNFSTLRNACGFTMPDEKILRFYRACGGELITLGSDAHRPADVAGGMQEALALLRCCGFDSIVTYRGGLPHVHPLDTDQGGSNARKDG